MTRTRAIIRLLMDVASNLIDSGSVSSKQAIINSRKNIIFAIMNAFCYSISFLITKYCQKQGTVSALTTNSVVISSICIFGCFKVFSNSPVKLPIFTFSTYFFTLLRSLTNALSLILYTFSYRNMSQDSATAIIYMFPLASSIFGTVVLKEEFNKENQIKFLVCLIGTVMMCDPLADSTENTMFGYIVSISAIFVTGSMPLLSKLSSEKVDKDAFMFISLLLYCPVAVVWYFFEENETSFASTTVLLLTLSGCCCAMGIYFYEGSFRDCDISIVAPFEYFALVFAFIYNVLFFGNDFSFLKFAGCVLIVGVNLKNVIRTMLW